MAKRKAVSKGLRFEIFKRDGFKCLYCGVNPVEKALRVDHVKPVVDGGTNDPTNLVTSCFDCNAGKGPVPLEKLKHSAGIVTDEERERPEQIREWLALQRDIDGAKGEVVDELVKVWKEELGGAPPDLAPRLRTKLATEPVEKIVYAIRKTGGKNRFDRLDDTDRLRYFYGVLKGAGTPKPSTPQKEPRALSWRAQRVLRHLDAINGKGVSIQDIFREFAIAAWGSSDEVEWSKYSEAEGHTDSYVRGLRLVTRSTGDNRVSWHIEEEGSDLEIIDGFFTDIECPLVDIEGRDDLSLEACRKLAGASLTRIAELRRFVHYLETKDDKPLAEYRERIGWPVPKWRVD